MKCELSILIPVYNYACAELVEGLCQQADSLSLRYEVIVAEDGSSDENTLQCNAYIVQIPHCRYIYKKVNVGRAAIRNFLAKESRYEWLLFMDCDMQLPDPLFLERYISSTEADVIDGGFGVIENKVLDGHNLRYTYEWHSLPAHTVEQRSANPYRSFRTTNFMIRRNVMLTHPFDERFLHYGYEDVLFGKELRIAGVNIAHIDNPMMLVDVESNSAFIEKTEESLRTLYQFRNELRGYSRLLTFVDGLHIGLVRSFIYWWHRIFGCIERRTLIGSHPHLKIFELYKIGYYLTLTQKD